MARRKEPQPPAPTLGNMLKREPRWCWVNCTNYFHCSHHQPMPIAPFVIRWAASTPSDLLRQRARCSKCGHKGATLTHPSMGYDEAGVYAAFPINRVSNHKHVWPPQNPPNIYSLCS